MKIGGGSGQKYFVMVLVALQAACAPVRPDNLAQPDKSGLGRVGIAVGQFNPEYKFEALPSGKGGGAAKGALGGALLCGGTNHGDRSVAAALAFIVCLPVAAVVGAVAGAVQAAPSTIDTGAQADLNARLAAVGQEPLREALTRYARDMDLGLSAVPNGQGPAAANEFPAYRDLSKDLDTVLEVRALELSAKTSDGKEIQIALQLKGMVRVINVRNGAVIDSFPVKSTPISRPLGGWLADGAKPVQAGIDAMLRDVAETAIDEVVLIYHPVRISDNADREMVPAYALRTIQPPLRTRYELGHARWGHLERYQLASTTPEFEWESFPRGYDIPIGEAAGEVRDVIYDFRLYADGVVVYERSGLASPKHLLESPLEQCREYRWTVRARFRLGDSVRATEWTGAFHTIGSTAAPWWWRRGSKPVLAISPPNVEYYPIVVSPSHDGRPCLN